MNRDNYRIIRMLYVALSIIILSGMIIIHPASATPITKSYNQIYYYDRPFNVQQKSDGDEGNRIAAGACFHEYVLPYVWIILIAAIILTIRPALAYWKGDS